MAITVNTATAYQTIEGLGVGLDHVGSLPNQAAADLLFSTSTGLGLSMVRAYGDPAANEAAPYAQTSAVLAAASAGARAIFLHFPPAPGYVYDLAAAQGTRDALLAWQALGVSPFGLGFANEPDLYDPGGMTGAQGAAYLEIIAPVLAAAGLGSTRLHFADVMSWSALAGRIDPILADAEAAPLLDAASVHGYFSSAFRYAACLNAGKQVWATEWNFQGDIPEGTASMANGLAAAQRVHDDLVTGEVSTWVWFIPWGCPAGTYGATQNWTDNFGLFAGYPDTSINTDTKRAWCFGNFSRFIRPGYRRVACTGAPAGVHASAYTGPYGDRVIVAINTNGTPTAIDVNGLGTATRVTPSITDATRNLVAQSNVSVVGGAFSYSLPASSVVTFASPFSAGIKVHNESVVTLSGTRPVGSTVTVT